MKKLTLGLLLVTVSGMYGEESLLTLACQSVHNTEETTKLVIFDIDKAHEATVVTVTIVRDSAVSDEDWIRMFDFAKLVYGEPTMQEDGMVKFSFERGEMSADAWFNLLSNLEQTFVAVRSTVEGSASVTVELV
jgi:hypothetical protein